MRACTTREKLGDAVIKFLKGLIRETRSVLVPSRSGVVTENQLKLVKAVGSSGWNAMSVKVGDDLAHQCVIAVRELVEFAARSAMVDRRHAWNHRRLNSNAMNDDSTLRVFTIPTRN